jgi:ATP-dependent Clp protease protease subunit
MLKLDRKGPVAQLYLYGTIMREAWWMDSGEVISAAAVLELLDQVDAAADLVVRINSDGGDVFEGIAIYNALAARSGRVDTSVDALAASISSVIAMAGDEIEIAGNAMLMIHQAWTVAAGNADEMAKVAQTLQQVDGTILETYAARVGAKSTRDQIVEWMKAETWMGATEAIERGFATRAGELKTGVAAGVKAGRFKNTPAALLQGREPQARRASTVPAIAARIAARRRASGVA